MCSSGEPGDLRVSDEDRDRLADELRDHFAAGRVTERELDGRVQRVRRGDGG